MQRKRSPAVKTATIPSLRVAPKLRDAAEDVLAEGESLSSFVEQSIRESIERRQTQREFLKRGMDARAEAKKSGDYVNSASMIGKLEKMLSSAKKKAKAR